MATTNARKDRFAMWPTVLTCCFPLILVIFGSVPFPAGVAVVFMIWVCSALLALGKAIFSASACYWWPAVSMSVLPLATLLVFATAGTIGPKEIGHRIHFQVMRRSYLEDVSKLPSSGEPRFAIWHWGELEPMSWTLLSGGLPQHNAVVYDESDEIMLQVKRVGNREVGPCGVLESLGDHFYIVLVGC